MILNILDIFLRSDKNSDGELVGALFRYAGAAGLETIRFVPADSYIDNSARKTLSLMFSAESEEAFKDLMRNYNSAEFSGVWLEVKPTGGVGSPTQAMSLPSWFQNLLPEGAFRQHIAELRKCSEDDYFELLAACGADLPGAVYAKPHPEGDMAFNQTLVTQDQDALEVSVVEIPMLDGISLSGVQPKLGVNLVDGRYVARQKLNEATRIIAKLPTAKYPAMPEVEHLSMSLARLAGVDACETSLQPLELLNAAHSYDLSGLPADHQKFLAVPRYDRVDAQRVHAEDFAQILGYLPHEKYARNQSYAQIMEYLLGLESLGEPAVQELLRRITVNELLGNPDCHLKNIGLYYPDGVVPQLPPAYDIVAHYVYTRTRGHALFILPAEIQAAMLEQRQQDRTANIGNPNFKPTPANSILDHETQSLLSRYLELPLRMIQGPIKSVCDAAQALWPAAIEASDVTPDQKKKMKEFLAEQLGTQP
ncbi:type II toxin-antitoxin system HipA family toxin [Comamonas thiooxydans]|uniref:type II toxin-antitoxin system HipA family toxin n=1 Tax=Comamonas thiooxydans TaxID=363952 RepID=UPI000B418388|nr:type II toxin-antitoxin system HipA family toxin [Comamonas thiooxydans]